MSKSKQRRFLVVLLTVALIVSAFCLSTMAANESEPVNELECYEHGDVNGDGKVDRLDAVYVLYNSYFPTKYPVKQDCDFQKDESVDRKDAVYLLYASFDMPSYPLSGTVHSYYEPVWTWNTEAAEVTAQVSFRCGCGNDHDNPEEAPEEPQIVVTAGTPVPATCVTAGSQPYTAVATYKGNSYTSETTVVIPANESGHDMIGTQTCTTGSYCSRCSYSLPALGHNWEQTGTEEATCTADAKAVYTCGRCGATDKVDQAGTAGCKLVYYGEKQGANEYQFIKQYQCSVCQTITDGEAYCKHNYIAKITLEATCSSKGSKTLTCSACGDEQHQDIPESDAHKWIPGNTVNGGVREYTCEYNANHTKTVVEVKEEPVPAADLQNNELQLGNDTTIALDQQAAEKLDTTKKILISVDEVDVDDTNMSDSEKAQVGNNAVYDFTMKYENGDPITNFEGEVTVRLPYTLKDTDNADSIDVWYIADDGSVECVKGVYSKGYVTFQTDHFSYYTVTRLTPAQRCTVYGHVLTTSSKAATCIADGYTTEFCQRCGWEKSNVVAPMLGHKYETIEDKAATCTATGLKKEQCQNCKEIKTAVIPAMGHDMIESQRVEASCAAAGKIVSTCVRNCGHKVEKELPQLKHNFQLTETVVANCDQNGYELYVCEHCKAQEKRNEVTALGHKWNADDATWQWNEDHTKATVVLTCANKASHTKEVTAVVTQKDETTACLGGTVTYTATASYNQITYTNSVSDTQDGPGHKPAEEWTTTDTQHYHLCSVCSEPVGAATHTWGQQNVVTPATCKDKGSATQSCTVCQKAKEVTLPATGVHTYENGVCTGCGKEEGSCDHRKLTERKIEVADYGVCGGYVIVRSCECGQACRLYDMDIQCENLENKEEELDNGIRYISTCADCGLRAVSTEQEVIDTDTCTGKYVADFVLTIGDTLIVSGLQYEGYVTQHPIAKEEVVIADLAELGLCGGKLVTESCACGLRTMSVIDSEAGGKSCDWTTDESGENMSCAACGATGIITESKETPDGCTTVMKMVGVISLNGQEVCRLSYSEAQIEHKKTSYTSELMGDSCEDGVYVKSTCTDCGFAYERYMTYHSALPAETIDTSAADMCTEAIILYRCACGQSSDFDFDYKYDGTDTMHQFDGDEESDITCVNCGLRQQFKEDESEKDEECYVTNTRDYTFTDGEGHTYTFTLVNGYEDHAYDHEHTLKGDSCEDGVVEISTCKDCGYSYKNNYEWHRTFETEVIDLSQHGFCGGGIVLSTCPCGQEEEWNYTGNNYCQWIPAAGDENFMESYCNVCGIVMQESWETEKLDACTKVRKITYTFLKNGQEICTFQDADRQYTHRSVHKFTLNAGATSCQDGYSAISTCVDCGYEQEFWSGGRCTAYPVARELLPSDGLCGQMELSTERCACGKETATEMYWLDEDAWCQFSNETWSEELNAYLYTCRVCGSKMSQRFEMELVEGCLYKETYYNTYWNAEGTELCSTVRVEQCYEHSYVYTFELNGETCDAGYTYSAVCAYCGEEAGGYGYGEGCSYWAVSRQRLEIEGLCGPLEEVTQRCACGRLERTTLDWASDSQSCQYGEGIWSGELGCNVYTCQICGSQMYYLMDSQESEENPCMTISTETKTYLDAEGNVLISKESTETNYNHPYVYTFFLNGETCESGFSYTATCIYCGYMENGRYESQNCDYMSWMTAYIAMPGCGGYVEERGCACGKNRWINRYENCDFAYSPTSYTTADGVRHEVSTGECRTCGMTMVRDRYSTTGVDVCHVVEHVDYTWSLGDWASSRSTTTTGLVHDFENLSCTLVNPGTSCEQGVNVSMRCRKCGANATANTYAHEMYKIDGASIDLAQYGSVCGAELHKMRCACGERWDYVLSPDCECDLNSKEVDHFSEDMLYEYHLTSDGWQDAFSYCYEYSCPVTDPAVCGLKLRMADCWLKEGCYAVKYRIWQTADGTEIAKVATGEKQHYHDYVEQERQETTGEIGKIEYQQSICKDCQSTDTYYYYFDALDLEVKYERIVVNNKNDGFSKSFTETNTYVYINDHKRIRSEASEMVKADGTVEWEQSEFSYDESNPCLATIIYTNSDGGYGERTELYHDHRWKTEYTKKATCTQFGEYVESYLCVICGQTEESQTYQENPTDHYWNWDDDQGMWICSVCSLESTNNGYGSIVMEDMTESYNNGNYVIGYWNRGEVSFNPYVSLVLYDAEDENDELVLTGIDLTYLTEAADGICGLSFSQSAVAEAAEAAIAAAGYTGSYAVRISFVPTTGESTLDYAITFDTVNA